MNDLTTTPDRIYHTVPYQDECGAWRAKIESQRKKFDDIKKERFLERYAESNLMGDAAKYAGVTVSTVQRHLETDIVFNEAVSEINAYYKDRLKAHQRNLVFNGTKKINYNRSGEIISEETIYPIRLIELELKAYDENYRDKREVDMKVSGGVMVAPPEVSSISAWEASFSNDRVIDGDDRIIDGD